MLYEVITIVAVADVFDALTSVRPYKPAWPLERAEAYLRECVGAHLDPSCVNAFFAGWDEVLDVHSRYRDEPSLAATELSINSARG